MIKIIKVGFIFLFTIRHTMCACSGDRQCKAVRCTFTSFCVETGVDADPAKKRKGYFEIY